MNNIVKCSNGNFIGESGLDVRNYGLLDGIPEAKTFFSEMLGVFAEEIIFF